ncbi:uncharacterized protein LOC116161627 isoform X3 [Photinus pyralis]|uniref:uncharacterized protein LOC116161627 isoform X3 n=1 Tax=Photinus pyralis TaxID=7054 RepID=UPI00126722FA|nr:uncharacterized protein LOC116161627 isoform X3 [Photinus pyralis]
MGRSRSTSLKSTGNGLLSRRRNRRSETLHVSWRDEQMDGLSLSLNVDATELNDPAILAVKPGQPVYRYTREELMQLRQVPLSQKRPEHLCNTFNNPNGFWDPELWHRNTVDTLLGPEPLDIHKVRKPFLADGVE